MGGGYIVAGYTNSPTFDGKSNHGEWDMMILKLDASGNLVWSRIMGGSAGDFAQAAQETTDGGFIIAGRTYSNDGDIAGNNHSTGRVDYWIVKLKSDGSNDWLKTFGGPEDDAAYAIQQTSDGGYIIAGESSSTGNNITNNTGVNGGNGVNGQNDFWLVKISASGTLEWQRAYGGTGDETAYSIVESAPGEYVVAGRTSSNDRDVSGNKGGYDYWVVKIKTDHTIEWQKTLGGSAQDIAYSIKKTSDNGFVIGGATKSNDHDVTGLHGSDNDYWVVKLKPNGDIYWQKAIGGTGNDVATSLQQTSDGGYIIAGLSTSSDGDATNSGYHTPDDFWVVKLLNDPPLSVKWRSISAILKEKNLVVNWATASEVNNDHFEIEISNDGTHFTKIGENIASKSLNGNTGENNNYQFNYTINGNLLGAGIISFIFGLLIMVKRRNKWAYTLAIVAGITLFGLSCTKQPINESKDFSKLFIRIAQVNKNGTKEYSKVVGVVPQ